ncbi:translation initiation factor IF-2 [Helicobacter mustelae]|uniref:Translation initiation factor IF-2 n=1 Tax=Helicobacter mustelae (strain ATCC 43772 / CCUG 25715 / CIP 103759 / LMG 18044 / NCTC 12198 / R85-136P) TaxID=679897 RepID=D3UG18_HELM1|nr:translation initiation factor IF-2 [Helicobacter mustelae]CBG39439.1 translation initiation factor IF-2 [Helicobacter mustelae 12198]SQH70951.1 translation initiation factor IF-2 [Helicobacter mustelae]STP12077.1 translation initiation factor IF-2 [Helicobacter mustelae]
MSAKVKISEIAQEVGKQAKEVLKLVEELGFPVKSVMSSIDQKYAEHFVDHYMGKITKEELIQIVGQKERQTPVKTPAKKTEKKSSSISKNPAKATPLKETKEAALSLEPIQEKKEQIKEAPAPAPQQLLQRRTGIRIVKKNNEEEAEGPKAVKKTHFSVQSMFDDLKDEEKPHRQERVVKKARVKHPQVSHKHNEQKMDLEREIGDHDDEEDNNEILLFDLHEQELIDEEKETQTKLAMVDRIKVQKKNPWMSEGGIGRRNRKKSKPIQNDKKENQDKRDTIIIPEEARVYEFADLAGIKLNEVVKVLLNLGMMVTKNDFLDRDAIEILCEEFQINFTLQNNLDELEYVQDQEQDQEQDFVVRPPVVTIMGHVDHGKTSLLDRIRNSRIVNAEAGGITQHIGAYSVEKNGSMISFVDTPGHEAFTEMRSRGAQITDIAIIVIAADDGVKQQTIEAFNHAKAAGVQIIVAMNKIDKENINIDRLKAECADLGFTPNDWGGEYEFIGISAKTGEGIETLLETILIQAEILELRANPKKRAKAVVLEGSMDRGRGPVATIVMQDGTLRVGDSVVADTTHGRVRALIDDKGNVIKEVGPSGVAIVVGLGDIPSAGSILAGVGNDAIAREYAQKRKNYLRQKELSKTTKVSFDELAEMVAKGNLKSVPIIIKADTQGSLEAIRASLEKLNNNEVQIQFVSFGVGGISESDVTLAAASKNCLILGFNIRPTGVVKTKSKELGVEIKTYSIIYSLIDDMKALVSGLMSPVLEDENTGQAEVRETFSIAKVGTIAGCMVVDGSIQRGIKIRLIRNGVVIHDGIISSLKRFKDDVREVNKGYECGIMLENFNDIQVGDVFETYKQVQRAQQI